MKTYLFEVTRIFLKFFTMSHPGKNFQVMENLSLDEIKNIKLLYIFFDEDIDQKDANKNIFFVTNQDVFKSFGTNSQGQLALGHQNQTDEPTLVLELCNKMIINLAHGLRHVIALTKSSQVYCWGRNDFGQLGIGNRDNDSHKPKRIKFFDDKFAKDICCGEHHSLVLTENGEVYAWGRNDCGQLGIESKDLYEPVQVEGFEGEKIKAISCGFWHSMALTNSGSVYCWGSNKSCQLGVRTDNGTKLSKKPLKVLIGGEVVSEICCGYSHSIVLSTKGEIYAFGLNIYGQLGIGTTKSQIFIPTKVDGLNNVLKIASSTSCDISVSLAKSIYSIWGKCGKDYMITPKKTFFDCFWNIFAYYKQITFKPIFLDEMVETSQIPHIFSYEIDYTLLNDKYKKEFTELLMIGEGSFSTVFKVKHCESKEEYAIKKVPLIGKLLITYNQN